MAITQQQLRASLFEFFHRLVRRQTVRPTSLMDDVVTDGMAIAFARDVGGVSPPWSVYPDNVTEWVTEVMALPPDTSREHFHGDSRRWITIQVGVYLVDQAMGASGRSSAQLVSASTDEVIRMALRE